MNFNLRWNLVAGLIQVCTIQRWRSFYQFSTENILFEYIWSRKSKLSIEANKIWYLDWFEYTEFNGDVHFFCFQPEIMLLDKFGSKN